MDRIDTLNRAVDLFGAGKDGFRSAQPGVSEATYLSPRFMNAVQESLVRTVELAGLVPADDHDQFPAAVKMLAESGVDDLRNAITSSAGVDVVGLRSTNLGQLLANQDARSYPRWTAALAKARAGLGHARVAWIGPSTVFGIGSNPDSLTADLKRRSAPSMLAIALRRLFGIRANAHSIWCDGFEGANISVSDPRITLGAGWTVHPTTFVAGGHAFYSQAKFNRLSWAPGVETDTCDIYYVTYPGYAEFIVQTDGDGEFLGSGVTTGPGSVGKVTVRKPLGMHRWDIEQSTDGELVICGIDAYNSADHEVSVWNMGASGSTVEHWATGNEGYDFRNAIQRLGVDLTLISLSVNDWVQQTPIDLFKARVEVMIDACYVTGDVLLVIDIPSNTAAAPAAVQELYISHIYAIAARKRLPVLDLYDRWVSQASRPERGFYRDGLHGAYPGTTDIGFRSATLIGNL